MTTAPLRSVRLALALWIATLALGLPTARVEAETGHAGRLYRIGFIGLHSPGLEHRLIAYLEERLAELGYVQGHNTSILYRWADGHVSRYPSIAEDLVRSRVDVIVTPCGPIIGAIRRLDRAMPVVFRSVDTETCAGEIADLDRPGGYTTGALYFSPDAVGRRLEVLKALVPGLSRVGVLHRPASEWAAHWAGADAAAAGMGLSLYRVEWRRNRLLSEAIDQAVSAGVGALLTFGDGYIFARRLEIFALAADRKLPVLYDFPIPPTAFERGLVSYAVDIRTLFRHVAEQVDRILQGDKPGDIPVARPRRFRLIIDHGAARALGLRVPRALLLRDRLLEHVEDVSALRARAHSPRD